MSKNLKKGQNITLDIFSVDKDKLTMTSKEFMDKNFIMFLDHYGAEDVKDFNDVYKRNDTIEATIENIDGINVLTSRKLQKNEDVFNYLQSIVNTKEVISAKIEELVNNVGLRLTYKGITLFLPAGQVEGYYKKEFATIKGQLLDVNVIKTEKRNNVGKNNDLYDVVVSRKNIIEQKKVDYEKNKEERNIRYREERKVLKKEEFASIKVGDIVDARVYKVEKGFALLYLKYGIGFLGGANYSHSRIEDLTTVLHPKDEIKAMVIEKDEDKERIVLSTKALTKTPYQVYKESHSVGTTTKGVVISGNEFGLIVDLAPEVTGFLHKYQVSYDPKKSSLENYPKGTELNPVIIGYEDDKNRISLSLKALETNAWVDVNFEVGSVIEVEVIDVSKRDITVKAQTLDIVISNKEVYFSDDEPRLKLGDKINVKVLDFNKNNWILRLSSRILKAQKEFDAIREMEKQTPRVEITIGDIIDQDLLDELEAAEAPKKKGKK